MQLDNLLICQEGCDEKPGGCKKQNSTRHLDSISSSLQSINHHDGDDDHNGGGEDSIIASRATREPVLRDASCKRDPTHKQDRSPSFKII